MSPITPRVIVGMIVGFADNETENVWNGSLSRRLPASVQQRARLKLRVLHAAVWLDDLRVPPANRLVALAGNRKRQHSIRIGDRWRICLRW